MDIETELLKYSRNRFKLEELKKKPLPEGVDPAHLETYLSDEDFNVSLHGIIRRIYLMRKSNQAPQKFILLSRLITNDWLQYK